MLSDFLHTLAEFFQYLWPFHIVQQWERGLYMVCGRVWKEVPPGLYPKLPWVCDIHSTNIAWEMVGTERHDVTLKDGRVLVFSATTMFRVVDVTKAVVTIHEYDHGIGQIISSLLAEQLAEIEPERLLPERRSRLNSSLEKAVHSAAAEFGMETKWLRFTTFVLNPKVFRLLSETNGFIS